jgi:hypothetical protein
VVLLNNARDREPVVTDVVVQLHATSQVPAKAAATPVVGIDVPALGDSPGIDLFGKASIRVDLVVKDGSCHEGGRALHMTIFTFAPELASLPIRLDERTRYADGPRQVLAIFVCKALHQSVRRFNVGSWEDFDQE